VPPRHQHPAQRRPKSPGGRQSFAGGILAPPAGHLAGGRGFPPGPPRKRLFGLSGTRGPAASSICCTGDRPPIFGKRATPPAPSNRAGEPIASCPRGFRRFPATEAGLPRRPWEYYLRRGKKEVGLRIVIVDRSGRESSPPIRFHFRAHGPHGVVVNVVRLRDTCPRAAMPAAPLEPSGQGVPAGGLRQRQSHRPSYRPNDND